MAEISMTTTGEGNFDVQVTEGVTTTHHVVTVPATLLQESAWQRATPRRWFASRSGSSSSASQPRRSSTSSPWTTSLATTPGTGRSYVGPWELELAQRSQMWPRARPGSAAEGSTSSKPRLNIVCATACTGKGEGSPVAGSQSSAREFAAPPR